MKKKEQDVLQTQKQKIDELELELSSQKSSLKMSEQSIKDENIKLQNALLEKTLSKEKIQEGQAMIDMMPDWKRSIEKIIGGNLSKENQVKEKIVHWFYFLVFEISVYGHLKHLKCKAFHQAISWSSIIFYKK